MMLAVERKNRILSILQEEKFELVKRLGEDDFPVYLL